MQITEALKSAEPRLDTLRVIREIRAPSFREDPRLSQSRMMVEASSNTVELSV
jgi:hypothetical protein